MRAHEIPVFFSINVDLAERDPGMWRIHGYDRQVMEMTRSIHDKGTNPRGSGTQGVR